MKILIIFSAILVFPSILAKLKTCNIASKGSLHFPPDFSFGVSSSSYQIEGGWNEDGKGLSLWDYYSHKFPEIIQDGSNGDVAADSYHRFDDDLKLLKDLNVGHYRFSISWSRIFPDGKVSSKNQAGVDYYNKIIDKLLENGITPLVTLHHFNLPFEIQRRGGFASPLIVDYFVEFATELFEMYGDRVKNWITFNEPWRLCKLGYGEGFFPPLLNNSGVGDYLCIHHILMAHGAAYQVYKLNFADRQGGKLGIAIDTTYFYATNPSEAYLVNRALQFNMGFLLDPILKESGRYPEVMVRDIARNSRAEGRFMSRMPSFDEEWKNIIKGSADFLGLNYYSSSNIRLPTEPVWQNPSFESDLNVEMLASSSSCDPSGLENVLHWLREEYNNIPVIITENGWRDEGEMEDDDRTTYLKGHVQAVLNAVNGGCNVLGYTHWSLVDSFEWVFGYTSKFGLYAINRTSPIYERIPKKSAHFYRKVIDSRLSPNEIVV